MQVVYTWLHVIKLKRLAFLLSCNCYRMKRVVYSIYIFQSICKMYASRKSKYRWLCTDNDFVILYQMHAIVTVKCLGHEFQASFKYFVTQSYHRLKAAELLIVNKIF